MKKFLPKSVNNPKGFTLIELLVVVSIIAILSVIGVTVFGNVQKNARDSRRKADIDSINKALEVKFDSITGDYPALSGAMFSSGIIPDDPDPAKNYDLTGNLPGKTYKYCATLETPAGDKYCKSNQQ